jgi:hypothetical protein
VVSLLDAIAGRVVRLVAQAVKLIARRPVLRRVLVGLLAVMAVRAWLGVWPAALLAGALGTAAFMAALAALDRRPPARHVPVSHPVPVTRATPRDTAKRLDGRHLEFARGLAGLAAWYLDECEREAER